jgi:hypothetical protein
VVSDLHRSLEDVRVTAVVDAAGERREWNWEGDIGADECNYVGSIDVRAPYAPGDITLDLTLQCGDVVATNRYTAGIA